MVKKEESLEQTTRERILLSAREVFLAKGMDGARMQEIADHAGINKALLHYYFTNKETLFNAVFNQVIQELIPALTDVFQNDRPLFEKISDFFVVHMDFVRKNPLLPQFVLSEISRNPDMILNGFKTIKQQGLFEKLTVELNRYIQKGEIKPVNPMQLIVNLVSLSVFPFVARPVIMNVFNLKDEEYEAFLNARKSDVAQFVINALK